jgi:hypothetical protein
MTTSTFGGESSTNRITESWQSSLSRRWKSSRTRTQSASSASSSLATAAAGSASRARPVRRCINRPSPTTRPSAAPMYLQSTVWSLSWTSSVNHANGRESWSAQSASSDVLPNPAGATTSASDGRDATRSDVSRSRRTMSGRSRAECSFVACRPLPGPPAGRPRAGSRPVVMRRRVRSPADRSAAPTSRSGGACSPLSVHPHPTLNVRVGPSCLQYMFACERRPFEK